MKQTIFSLLVVLGMNVCDQAQDNRQERRFDKKEMINMRTNRMVERYGLNEEQKAKLQELNTQYADSMNFGRQRGQRPPRDISNQPKSGKVDTEIKPFERPSREGMQAMREKAEATQKAYEAEVKKIMTEEQFAKYTEDRNQMRQRRPDMGGNRPRGQRPQRQNAE